MKRHKAKNKSTRKSTIVLVVILLAGLSLLLYPTVSDYWNSFHQSRAIASYDKAVAEIDTKKYDEMLEKAQEYNASLWDRPDRYLPTKEETAEYESLLDVTGTGMMGYIEIPSIDCSLPIYHGTGDEVIQVGAGHIEGTSLPVGGEDTHCVLTGHRGLPSARLFTDLDQLEEGDIFMLKVLNETLTYEVDQIRIVLPEEMEELGLVKGKDYCTLVTCTPYGVNSHRMLIRGHRTANRSEGDIAEMDAKQLRPSKVMIFIAVPILLVLLIRVLVKSRKRKKK